MALHEHWWIIERATGPTSQGRCQDCGETATFSNRLPFDGAGGGRWKGRRVLSRKGADLDAAYRDARRIAAEAM